MFGFSVCTSKFVPLVVTLKSTACCPYATKIVPNTLEATDIAIPCNNSV